MDGKRLRKIRWNIVLTCLPAYVVGYFSYRKFTTLKSPYKRNYTKYYMDTLKEMWDTGRIDKDKYFHIKTYTPTLKGK